MTPMTLFCADIAGQETNKHYPHKHDIITPDDLAEAVRWDHVAAQYHSHILAYGVGSYASRHLCRQLCGKGYDAERQRPDESAYESEQQVLQRRDDFHQRLFVV